MATGRALHFVFKIGDRTKTAKFYRDVLGMKFLRHEEFEEGCEASCNGPYNGKWSKSMVGYGPEDTNFVVELTYNYEVDSYKLGNDFRGLTIHSRSVLENAAREGWPVSQEAGQSVLTAPDGYKFFIVAEDASGDPVKKVTLSSSNVKASVDYWVNKCGMKMYSETAEKAELGYGDDQCKLELVQVAGAVDHATAFGRIAFACPRKELPGIEAAMKEGGQTILKPLVALDTPGKATVEVVILADPDGHEICFVGDEAFRELSQTDPKADALLDEAIAADKSNEWFAKKGRSKAAA